jgi:3-deoxy-manno-octulosonate cytidylyltransferase (CMP-KDO synthetase)
VKIIGLIPARYASSRFPGKPLVELAGKSMIRWVYEAARKSKYLSEVVVATDHPEILEHVQTFGQAVLTSPHHPSGTDRCFEALQNLKASFDYVINIQGDEPFIEAHQIDLLATRLDGSVEIATLIKKITSTDELFNPSEAKVVLDVNGNALLFSRSPIPHIRNKPEADWIQHHTFYKHVGLYAYRTDVLEKITRLNASCLETAESLEQLRWLENGFKIRTIETDRESFGIDTPADVPRALEIMKART